MKQGEDMNELDDLKLLKKYLLGTLDDETVQTRIEERLMVDDEFAARVSFVEEELIEEFLDGEMTADERDLFNRVFLAPPERMRQLRLTRGLRRVAAEKAVSIPHRERVQSIFSIGWLRFAFAGAALLLVALGVWRFAIYESNTDKGLIALREAYQGQRPVQPRITGFDSYAPYSETRGPGETTGDPSRLNRAGLLLTEAANDSGDPAAHQALANYYIARGQLVDAEREMKLALDAKPNDARIQSDAGAMYFQIAGRTSDAGAQFVALSESMTHLNRAIELNPKLKEAFFNRALTLGELRYTEEAKAAWRAYLELDSTSKWADEARQHIEVLEQNTPTERSAEQLESDFLDAFRAGRQADAEKLISANREPIRDKYLPVRLSMIFLNTPEDRRAELLNALEYTGKIEMKLTGDPFAKEIALFYRNASASKWGRLRDAHQALRTGLDLCWRLAKYKEALPFFQKATEGFEVSGDLPTAKFTRYFVAYAMANTERYGEAYVELKELEEWAREHHFAWLRMTTLHWLASCLVNAKQLTEARRTYEEALSIAEKLDDSYAKQRNLSLLAHVHSVAGQEREALRYLFLAIKESDKPETSLRQRYRNLFYVLPIVFRAGLIGAGKFAALEVMRSADQQKDPVWIPQSRALASIAAAQTGDLAAARKWLEESREKAASLDPGETRDKMIALANLRTGDFERMYGNVGTADRWYRQALEFYVSAQQPMLREEASEGLLLTYLATRNTEALEKEIPANIALAEEYRTKLLDEDQSIGFFDVKGSVYDVAAEFEFDRGNIERAYDYVEASSARVLLDRMQRRTKVSVENLPPTTPLQLSEIREQLPIGVVILQYSVFEKKSVVWIVSREGVTPVTVAMTATDLSARVSKFSQAISHRATADSAETKTLAAELYKLLIQPVVASLDPYAEVCIIPTKFLFDLPFAALIDGSGKPLVSDVRLVYAPSANVFLTGSRNASARQAATEESVLAVGNPAFERERFNDLADLPDSEEEAKKISQLYPHAETLLHEQATKQAFLDALANSDVIHFAGHYVAMPGAPMSSFLLLAADGADPAKSELSNAELSGVSIPRARLIVLASCQSGIESYYRSEGMAGMSRTILAAQVPLVVASQWSVDSAGTEDLMTRFHELRQKQHLATTAALRQAQLDLLNDPSGKFSSPYYWAAFAAYGGHAEF